MYGTNDPIQSLKVLTEKTIDNRPTVRFDIPRFQGIWHCFVTVELLSILTALKHCTIDQRHTNVFHHIYSDATTTINLYSRTKAIKIKRGGKQERLCLEDCGRFGAYIQNVRNGITMVLPIMENMFEYALPVLKHGTETLTIRVIKYEELRKRKASTLYKVSLWFVPIC